MKKGLKIALWVIGAIVVLGFIFGGNEKEINQETQEDLGENLKEVNSLEDLESVSCNTRNGITLCLGAYTFENKGTFGTLKSIIIGVENQGNEPLFPYFFFEISDKEDTGNNPNRKGVDVLEITFEGDIYLEEVIVDMPVGRIENDKIVKVFMKETEFGSPYVVTEFETNFLEN